MTQAVLLEEKLISRLNELITQADTIPASRISSAIMNAPTLDSQEFQRWKTSSENLIAAICGSESVYLSNFTKATKNGAYTGSTRAGKGILLAVKDDVEAGLITTVKSLAIAEVFVDFIEIAEHLLAQGYKDPAASLIGAVLEDSLRKIAESNEVTVKNSDDISALNNKLADKGVYSRIVQKQIHAWKAIRDHADHGKFNEYTKDDVGDFIKGVTRFVAENQK